MADLGNKDNKKAKPVDPLFMHAEVPNIFTVLRHIKNSKFNKNLQKLAEIEEDTLGKQTTAKIQLNEDNPNLDHAKITSMISDIEKMLNNPLPIAENISTPLSSSLDNLGIDTMQSDISPLNQTGFPFKQSNNYLNY